MEQRTLDILNKITNLIIFSKELNDIVNVAKTEYTLKGRYGLSRLESIRNELISKKFNVDWTTHSDLFIKTPYCNIYIMSLQSKN